MFIMEKCPYCCEEMNFDGFIWECLSCGLGSYNPPISRGKFDCGVVCPEYGCDRGAVYEEGLYSCADCGHEWDEYERKRLEEDDEDFDPEE